jgi:hypothetical protein
MDRTMPPLVIVAGTHRGRPDVRVQCRAGELGGDPFAVADVEDAILAGRRIDVAGVTSGVATLDPAVAGPDLVIATLTSVFDEVDVVRGLEPEDVPRGAEA